VQSSRSPTVVWQWTNEIESRFGLSFAVVARDNRDFVRRCRRERGYSIRYSANRQGFKRNVSSGRNITLR
jgi:hypothetical protein